MVSMKVLGKGQQGFSLIELLIVILIVGILAAVATPLYLGYVRDARTTEAKGIMGSLWVGLQGCAQAAAGTGCSVFQQFSRGGLDAVGNTFDGRWRVSAGSAGTVTLATATNTFTVTGFPVDIAGLATENTGITVRYNWDPGTSQGNFHCDTGSGFGAC